MSKYISVWLTGRMTAHDIAAFAQDSVITPLTSLDPSDFPDRVVLSRDPWFVDFFAPVGSRLLWSWKFDSFVCSE